MKHEGKDWLKYSIISANQNDFFIANIMRSNQSNFFFFLHTYGNLEKKETDPNLGWVFY